MKKRQTLLIEIKELEKEIICPHLSYKDVDFTHNNLIAE